MFHVEQFGLTGDAVCRLEQLVELVRAENARQNLIAANTADDAIWSRHIVDSLQLLRFADRGPWLDLGTGGGFPGLALAAAGVVPMTMVEERRRRADFLRDAAALVAPDATVLASKVERIPDGRYDVISARAFAPLPKLLQLAHRFSHPGTMWLLPKGARAADELDSIAGLWHGTFRLEASVTDPNSAIIVATDVRPVR